MWEVLRQVSLNSYSKHFQICNIPIRRFELLSRHLIGIWSLLENKQKHKIVIVHSSLHLMLTGPQLEAEAGERDTLGTDGQANDVEPKTSSWYCGILRAAFRQTWGDHSILMERSRGDGAFCVGTGVRQQLQACFVAPSPPAI